MEEGRDRIRDGCFVLKGKNWSPLRVDFGEREDAVSQCGNWDLKDCVGWCLLCLRA